jgi:hypothetical protein
MFFPFNAREDKKNCDAWRASGNFPYLCRKPEREHVMKMNKLLDGAMRPRATGAWEALALLLFTVLYAGIYRQDLFFRVQELSLFLPGCDFFVEAMGRPGGALWYAGRFLTQFFHYPLVGGLLLAVLLLLVRWCTASLLAPVRYRVLSCLPALLLLLSILRLDYQIFVSKDEELLFSPVLGMLGTLLLLLGWRRTGRRGYRLLLVVLMVVVGYPLLGFYALFAALVAGGVETFRAGGSRWVAAGTLAGMLAWIAACPWLYFCLAYTRLNVYRIYTAGLPAPADHGNAPGNTLLLAAALALVAAYAIRGACRRRESAPARRPLASLLCLLALLVGLCFLANRDANFHALLSIQRAATGGQWERVLEKARQVKHPDRTISLYRNVALLKQNRLCEEMFTYPPGDAPMPTYPRLVYIAGSDLLFHHGRLSHAYRWAVEHLVQHGLTVDYLRHMIKVALLKGEFALAQKYVNTLGRTCFYSDVADRYQLYIRQPRLINDDPEFRSIRGLLSHPNVLGEESGALEPYLLEYFRDTPPASREMLELAVAATLTLKDKERFRALLPLYRENGLKTPRHAQEAALLFAHLDKRGSGEIPGIDDATRGDFARLLKAMELQRATAGDALVDLLRRSFDRTYWYYYFAVKDLKTN